MGKRRHGNATTRHDTHAAMIKFSHAELDHRIRALDEGFAVLQARDERLESSTH